MKELFAKIDRSSLLFTLAAVLLIGVLVLVSCRQKQDRAAAEAAAVTPVPVQETKSTGSPAGSSAAFGRSPQEVLDDLPFLGVSVLSVSDSAALTLHPEAEAPLCARLTLSASGGRTGGFVLAFPAPAKVDDDGSEIAALLQENAEDALAAQQQDMEELLLAVLQAYDENGKLPDTVRTEWAALYGAYPVEEKKKTASQEGFRFSLFSRGTGEDRELCCSVQK